MAKKRKRKQRRKRRWWIWPLLGITIGGAWWWWTQPTGIRGIDVSHYQGDIDWEKVKGSGIAFAFIKASEGESLVDAKFKQNWKASKKAGLKRGAYHFFRPSVDAEIQAKLFLKQFKQQKGDLPPVLDLEVTDGKSAAEIRKGALKWMEIVEKKSGRRPILYTMAIYAKDYLGGAFGKYPLWIVRLRRGRPQAPKPWKDWVFWQYSHHGHVEGIPGEVDLNIFEGSVDDLESLGRR